MLSVILSALEIMAANLPPLLRGGGGGRAGVLSALSQTESKRKKGGTAVGKVVCETATFPYRLSHQLDFNIDFNFYGSLQRFLSNLTMPIMGTCCPWDEKTHGRRVSEGASGNIAPCIVKQGPTYSPTAKSHPLNCPIGEVRGKWGCGQGGWPATQSLGPGGQGDQWQEVSAS